MNHPKSRRLAAIMFTDIQGYTALMQQDEQNAAAIRAQHREVFQKNHDTYHGEILQYFGDGTLSVFQSGVEAVECAVAIQKALKEGEPVPLRIGIHTGDIVFDGTEIYGDGVNLASRIEGMGVAGSILISGKLNEELKNQPHLSTESLGQFSLKNIAQPIEVFAVTNEGITHPQRSELKGKQQQEKSIAVLPFVNMSSDPENEYFSDGMTEEIINALAKIQHLKVTSRTSSFFFKNKNIPITQIGRELNVSTILEGSIRLAGNRMRITAQLIDVVDDVHFWSESFNRSVDDIFAVQDEVSLLIADKLREHVGHLEIQDHLVEKQNISVDFYKQYLKSRYLLLRMRKADIDEGMEMLEKIIETQPDYSLAYLGMHLGYTLMGTIGFMPSGEAFTKAQPYLDKAIELDPDHPECQLHLSWIAFLHHYDVQTAYKHLQKAIETRPVVDFYQSMASILVAERKFTAAMNYIETATQIDPFAAVNYHLKGFIFYCQEKYEQAKECFEKSVELKPDFMASTLYLGQTLLLLGPPQKGLDYFQGLPDDEPGDVLKLGGITLSYAALGKMEMVKHGIEQLEAALKTEAMERAVNFLIMCNAMLGEKDKALDWIDQGVSHHLPMMVYLYVEPILKTLHSQPRFQELIKQVLGEETDFDLSQRKYKKSLFDPQLLIQYRHQLEQLMEEKQPYLDPDLSLRSLSEMMDIPANHLSQLLNEGFNKNFSEFVNDYRLEAFKSKVSDPSHQHMTLLALAYDSGFNSKTVFNTFFKKAMGMTPRAYWKKMVNSKDEYN